MGGTCSTDGETRNVYTFQPENLKGRHHLRDVRRRLLDIIKTNLKETGCEDAD